MKVEQKDIVLLPYPFTDLRESKVRPALVISNENVNNKSDDAVMIPLTTVIKDEPFSINISQNDLDSGKLLRISRIKIDKIFTVEQKLVLKKIGSLNNNTFKKVKDELFKLF